MSKQVSSVVIDLQARTGSHDTKINKSRTALRQYAGQAKSANSASHTLANGFGTAANQAGVMYGPLNGLSGRLSAVSSGIRTMGPAGFAGAAGMAALTLAASKGLDVFERWESLSLKTEALIASTGNAAGLTAQELNGLAREVALNTLGSVEGAIAAINVLQTFKTVQGEVFRDAVALSHDLAAVMGGDAKSAAQQLGKALEDPATGMNALKRSGVSFSAQERIVIKDLQDTNRLAEAQGLILSKLADQVGGAGSGAAQGLAGAYDTLGQRYDEFLFDLTETSRLGGSATWAINTLAEGIHRLNKELMPDEAGRLNELVGERLKLQDDINRLEATQQNTIPGFGTLNADTSDLRNARAEFDRVSAEIVAIQDARKAEQVKQTEARLAAQSAAEAARLDHEQGVAAQRAATQQKAATDELALHQQTSAAFLQTLDLRHTDEQGRLQLQHEARQQKIAALQLSDAELARQGFETLDALRLEYKAREDERYQLEQQALADRTLEEQTRELDSVRQLFLSKEEIEIEAHARRQLLLDTAHQNEQLSDQRHAALSVKNTTLQNKKLKQIQDAKQSQMLAGYKGVFDGVLGLTEAFGGKQSKAYKVMFAASKAFALAESIIKIQQGISSAAALGFPAGIPAMAQVVAATSGVISTIQGTSLQGMAHSGIDYVPKEGTWLLDKGERVLSPRQNADFTAAMKGGGLGAQPVVIHQVFHINSDDGSSSQTDADSQSQFGEFAEFMGNVARQAIQDEQQPGGLLAAG